MTTWLPRWIACLVLVLPFVPPVAADPDDKDIERLVKQLGNDDYFQREEATKRLKEIGEPALDALHQATTSDDLEVRRRAEKIVAVLYGEPLRLIGKDVVTVVVSADGKQMLTGGRDKAVQLWDADTGKELRVFEGHPNAVLAVALSPDGKRVLSASDDDSVRLWDAQTGKELRQMSHDRGRSSGSVAFGPEGKALSGDRAGKMYLWDLNTGKKAGVFTGPPPNLGVVNTVAYSEKAKLAVTAGTLQPIFLWNLETGKVVREFADSDGSHAYFSACFSPDGKRLAGNPKVLLRIWDVETGKLLFGIDDVRVTCVAFSPDGKRLVTGGHDNTVRVWDADGKELRNYEGQPGYFPGGVGCVMFFPDGKRIASVSCCGTVRIWRAPR